MLDFLQIYRSLAAIDKNYLMNSSAVRKENNFYNLLKIIKPVPKVIVEIGTYKGIGTVMLASLAEKVYTFDILYQPDTEFVWRLFNIEKKIEYYIVGVYKEEIPLMEVTRAIRNEISIFWVVNRMIDHKGSRNLIEKELRNLDFDFAFIDGRHNYEDAKKDFEIVKKCGRVLFHDVVEKYPGMQKFIKEIRAKTINEFGYWEDK